MIKVYNEDCLAGMKNYISNDSIDICVTSPPYNLKKNYNEYSDDLPEHEYLDWCHEWLLEIHRCLSESGSLFLNLGSKPTNQELVFQILERSFYAGFLLQNTIVWVKYISLSDAGQGHYKPINSKRYVNDCFEYIFHLTKNGKVELDRLSIGVPYKDTSNIKRWKLASSGVHCRGNVWFMPYSTVSGPKEHPAAFPIELPLNCIKLHGLNRCNTVLDPFLGGGTSALAAQKLNKNFIGFELDKLYYNNSLQSLHLNTIK